MFAPWSEIDPAELPPRETGGAVIDGGYLTLRWGGYDYDIALDRIKTPQDVMWWLHHLGSKDWPGMTPHRVSKMIELLATHYGWEFYGHGDAGK